MKVLIVESSPELSQLWKRHLERQGASVRLANSQAQAITALHSDQPRVIILSLDLDKGSALAIADFASYRWPETRVIFVTRKRFFSDGSIFQLVPNTAAFVAAETAPEDLAALVQHHGGKAA